ncbi:MAG TPA: hypothetical protein VKU02_04610 [Gemmataceae bacterium]|nr:hypothetical protein [Gemmataceae bacterium]
MRVILRLVVTILPIALLIGCDNGKPKPAELPKRLMDPPKTRPIPGGGSSKAPPQTGQAPSRSRLADCA